MSVFGENNSCRLSNFLQTLIFWNFDHISRIYKQINYKDIWFPKVIINLIMTAQVLFFNVFSEKDQHLNGIEPRHIHTWYIFFFTLTKLSSLKPGSLPFPFFSFSFRKIRKRRNQQRKQWVREVFSQRESHGAYNILWKELRLKGRETFFR